MPIAEKDIIPIDPNNIDNALAKVKRHFGDLMHGRLDINAMQRGVFCIFHEAMTQNLLLSNIRTIESHPDAYGVPDLQITTFHVTMPPPFAGNLLPHSEIIKETARFIQFPTNSRLRIHIHEEPGKNGRIHTSQSLNEVPNAIAAFTGPTSIRVSDYPNNGFYDHGKVYKEFGSSEFRKGAFVIFDDENMELLTDEEKWELIGTRYLGVTSLVGTSFYMTSEDLPDNEYINRYNGKGRLSYLAQYVIGNGAKPLVFVIASMSSRKTMKDYLDRYKEILNAHAYMALELERDLSDCFFKSKSGLHSINNQGFEIKPEHYVITVPTNS